MAPRAPLLKPFAVKMDQERAIIADVTRWLRSSDARR
jgi:hypothetical protein